MVKSFLFVCLFVFPFNFYSVVLSLLSPHFLFLFFFFSIKCFYFHLYFFGKCTSLCTGRNNTDLIKHKCSDKIRLLLLSILCALWKESRTTHRLEAYQLWCLVLFPWMGSSFASSPLWSEHFRPTSNSQLHLLQLADCFSTDFLAKWAQGY